MTAIKNLLFSLLFMSLSAGMAQNKAPKNSPVAMYGQLSIKKGQVVDQSGKLVQLEGMSLFWSQWQPKFYNKKTLKNLAEHWNIDLIRAAMAVEHEGYLEHPEKEMKKVQKVIDAAIDQGIYVIVDWHDHHAQDHLQEAKTFFSEIAKKYGHFPNIIYEPFNEPLNVSWSEILKPYHEAVLKEIRKYDPDNIVVLGTPEWSQRVDLAAKDPMDDPNVAYTLHFYAGTHKEELREKAEKAINTGLPLFVTEYGTVNANGDGEVAKDETQKWYDFMNKHQISSANWSVANKDESSAALLPGSGPKGLKNEQNLTASGKFVRAHLLKRKKL